MSRTLNIISNNIQGYGSSESTSLPCLGLSGRAVNVSTCPRSEFKTAQVKMIKSKCSLNHVSFICKASSEGQRKISDFWKPNRSVSSQNRNRSDEERNSSENLDESELLSTKNGPLLSVSNSQKSRATATQGQREREIVELFRKVQARLRQRTGVKEEKKVEVEAVKGRSKESESVDSLLNLLRKHSVEQGKRKVNSGGSNEFSTDHSRQSGLAKEDKRKVNGGGSNEFSTDHSRQSGQSKEDMSKSFFNAKSFVKKKPQEANKPSNSRPPSSFKRKSPVPRVEYEPVITRSDLDIKTSEITEADADPESDSYLEPEIDLVSGLELEQEEEGEVEAEAELNMEAEFVDRPKVGTLSDAEFLDAEEEGFGENDAEKEHTVPKDLNAMNLADLRALAKSRGMKGFSKLKKSELVGLLSEDIM